MGVCGLICMSIGILDVKGLRTTGVAAQCLHPETPAQIRWPGRLFFPVLGFWLELQIFPNQQMKLHIFGHFPCFLRSCETNLKHIIPFSTA